MILLTLGVLFTGIVIWCVKGWFDERKKCREAHLLEEAYLKQKLDEINLERRIGLR